MARETVLPWVGGGPGSRLVALARQRHPDGLARWASASNVPAVRFDERHGFEVVRG